MENIKGIESGRALTINYNNFIYIYYLPTRNLYKYDIYNNSYQYITQTDFTATNIYLINNILYLVKINYTLTSTPYFESFNIFRYDLLNNQIIDNFTKTYTQNFMEFKEDLLGTLFFKDNFKFICTKYIAIFDTDFNFLRFEEDTFYTSYRYKTQVNSINYNNDFYLISYVANTRDLKILKNNTLYMNIDDTFINWCIINNKVYYFTNNAIKLINLDSKTISDIGVLQDNHILGGISGTSERIAVIGGESINTIEFTIVDNKIYNYTFYLKEKTAIFVNKARLIELTTKYNDFENLIYFTLKFADNSTELFTSKKYLLSIGLGINQNEYINIPFNYTYLLNNYERVLKFYEIEDSGVIIEQNVNIDFYKFNGDNKQVDKTNNLQKQGTITMNFLDTQNKKKLKFLLQKNDIILKSNYVYIPIFNRYYYINNLTIMDNNLIEIDLNLDYLYTYKDLIYRQNALIEYGNKYINNDLVDTNIKKGIYSSIDFIKIEPNTETEFEFKQDNENYNYVLNLVNPKGAI